MGRPNAWVAIFMLIVLAIIAGPNLLPRIISRVIPGFDEGVACSNLPRSSDRANHQSILGRNAENPLAVSVGMTPISGNPADVTVVAITVSNTSLGTVPFVFNPNQVIVGDNGSTGLGVVFSPSNSLTAGTRGADPASFPESDIRLLAPRQSCLHRLEFPNGNVLVDPALTGGSATVRAYYRANSRGVVVPASNTLATPIYNDQGLWAGYVESEPIRILRAGP